MDTRQLSLWHTSQAQDEAYSIDLGLPDAEIDFYPVLFDEVESDRLFAILYQETSWQQDWIKIAGQSILVPRLTAWYGEKGKTYTYSGITMVPQAWTGTLLYLKSRLETLANTPFNSVLLNFYRNGRDSVAWHSDDESELGHNPVIASFSLGGTRRFMLRHKHHKTLKHTIELTHGSCLLMQGSTQHYWMHQVPKTAKPVAPRINLTFRKILECDRR
jgi:alkylated DNA repair dioxygenase AlkB